MSEQVPEKTDYEIRMAEHYDPSGIDPVFGGRPCPATHPVTGRPCVYPEGHDEHHWAMGERRMQIIFGPNLTAAAPVSSEDAGGNRTVFCADCGPVTPERAAEHDDHHAGGKR